MFYLASKLAFYLADNVCVLPNKTQLCVLPCKTQFCTSAPDTVIPGQDQGSHLNNSTMPARARSNNNKDTRTKEHKNTNNVHSTVSAETSFCPYIRMSIMTKETKERTFCSCPNKRAANIAPQVQTFKGQMNIKLA